MEYRWINEMLTDIVREKVYIVPQFSDLFSGAMMNNEDLVIIAWVSIAESVMNAWMINSADTSSFSHEASCEDILNDDRWSNFITCQLIHFA